MGGPFRIFKHPLLQNIKKLKGGLWEEKNFRNCQKIEKGGPSGIFKHSFCRKTSKKLKGDPVGKFCFRKINHTMQNKN